MFESKQIKVDNWGIFFLQRLQQFYNNSSHCDLTLLFDDHRRIRVHRLVLNACTEYFQVLEKTCPIEDNCMRMPANLPSDIVIPIINFMYSGILDLNEASFDRLYSTAKLMNMSVLTKLLDAQKTPIKPIMPQKRLHATPVSWHSPVKKVVKSTSFVDDLPETLPGRKLPIWRRKSLPISSTPYLGHISSQYDNYTPLKPIKKFATDEPPKPTRFDWPENDSENNFDNAFDDISYESKPLILPSYQTKEEKSPKPSTSSTFEEIKKTAAPVKRSASPIGNQPKKVNLQDVKEYLKEHKIRSDYIDYEEEEGPDNDLQPFDNEGDSTENTSQNIEDIPNKSILKNEGGNTPSNKHVRFSLEGEEDKKTPKKHVSFSLEAEEEKKAVKITPKGTVTPKSEQDMSKHTKIIAEVLKKYPHLVKNNKNIRLKILAKGTGSPSPKAVTKTTPTKNPATTKVSYMVMRPEENKKQKETEKEHICTKCDKPLTFSTYPQLRQHLIDVHNEKQDSQMCMVCGHVARKQNMLVYHKFVKHNITPPIMYNFPKCKECSYIALSSVVLQKHMATHTQSENQFMCKICNKKFISETNLNTHIESIHGDESSKVAKIETKVTKEKIKILSDVKVVNQSYQSDKEVTKAEVPTEPSSEAEALSNVASGIAASLGLVDTIVVLDDNQFILQSQAGNIQQNIINSDGQEYIIPEMQLNEMESSPGGQNQQNNVLAQTIKTGITSTDELVMVLTDHDYGDGNNAVITDNNIVVLYSHPVQTQAGTMMLTSEGNMIEVDKSYTQNIPVTIAGNCEESIEMIQQEINNQLDTPQEINNTQIEQSAPIIHVQSNIQVNPASLPEKQEEPVEEQSYEEIHQEQPLNGALEQVEQVNESVQEVEQSLLEENVVQSEENVSLMEQQVQNETEMEERLTQLDDQTGQVVYVTQSEENVTQIVQEAMEIESQIQETQTETIEANENEQNMATIQESLPQNEEVAQFEENVTQIEENNQEENLDQMESNVAQAEQETQDQNVIDQDPNQSREMIHDENMLHDSELQENLSEIPGETMENEQNVCQETSECIIEENIDQIQQEVPQTEENMLEQEEQTMSQFEETSQIPEITENVPQIVETDATTQQQEEMETTQNLANDSQQVMEENEVQIDSNMIQDQEESSQIDQPTEMEQEAQILNQIEENIPENEEEIIQEENMPENVEEIIQEENMPENVEEIIQGEENVPYEEERLPIDASLEQIGDVPQNEENGSSLNDAQNSVQAEVDESIIQNETEVMQIDHNAAEVAQIDLNEAEVTQIDQIEAEVDQELVEEDANLEMNENITDVSDDLDQNEMATDEQVHTSLVEEVNENIETNKCVKTQDISKETPIQVKHDRIMKILDDWDDGESDSQQSLSSKSQQNIDEEKIESSESIKKLIDDWEEEEDT